MSDYAGDQAIEPALVGQERWAEVRSDLEYAANVVKAASELATKLLREMEPDSTAERFDPRNSILTAAQYVVGLNYVADEIRRKAGYIAELRPEAAS